MIMSKTEKILIYLHSLYIGIVSLMIIWQIIFVPFRNKFDSAILWIVSLLVLLCLPVIGAFSIYKAVLNPIHSAILHVFFWVPQIIVIEIQKAIKTAPRVLTGDFNSYLFYARGGPSFGFCFGMGFYDKPIGQRGMFEIASFDVNCIAISLFAFSILFVIKNRTEPGV